MFLEKHIPHRKPGEKLLTYVRPHWLILVKSTLFTLVLLAIPALLYIFVTINLPRALTNTALYVSMVFLGTLYYLVVLQMYYNRFIDYHLDIWIVTNHRIIAIVQNNIFNRTVSEHMLSRIQDVSANQQGLLQTFFNYGDVSVQTAGEEKFFLFDNVPQPFEIARQINELAHKEHSKERQ